MSLEAGCSAPLAFVGDRIVPSIDPPKELSPMSVTIRIPTALRKFADGRAAVQSRGATVGEVLDDLMEAYPGLAQRIYDEGGELRRFVNVFLGDEDIRFLDRLGTPVSEGAELSIIPAIAGGLALR